MKQNQYHISRLFFIFAIYSYVSSTSCWGQDITVYSEEDKSVLSQVHVICKSIPLQKEFVFITSSSGNVSLDSIPMRYYPLKLTLFSLGYFQHHDTLKVKEAKRYTLRAEQVSLNEVVITGQYAPNNPENAIHKVKIIDRKRIELQGAQNLRDVLSNELNIRISQDNILGSSMSLQGMSGQNVKILIDGVPVIGRLDGNIDLSQINLNNIERIEIIEGPLSVNYGTDALAGTINLITKKTQKTTLSSSISTYYESVGQYNASGRIGFSKNKTSVSMFGGRNYFDGWRTNDNKLTIEKAAPADSNRFMNWKPKEQIFGTLMINQRWKNLNFGFTSDYFYEQILNRGKPRTPYFETAFDDYYKTNRFNNSINVSGKISTNYNVSFIAAYNYFERTKNTYFKDLTTLEQNLTGNSSDHDTSTFKNFMSRSSISNTKDSSRLHYEIGYDLYHETAVGKRIENQTKTLGDYAVFGSVEYQPVKILTIRPGLRYAYNTSYTAPLIPSLNVKLNIKKITLRASYAKGFRAPSLKELYFYFVDINHNIQGNSLLKAEQSDNYSLSLTRQYIINQSILKFDMSFFYNSITNMITLAQTSGADYTYVNIGVYKTKGININSELAFNHIKLSVGGSCIGRYDEIATSAQLAPYNYSPELRSNLLYEFKKSSLSIALFYKYTGTLNRYALDPQDQVYQTKSQDFHTADLSVSKALWNKKMKITLGSKNIFNVTNITGSSSSGAHNQSATSIPVAMGRTYFIKLDLTLNSSK